MFHPKKIIPGTIFLLIGTLLFWVYYPALVQSDPKSITDIKIPAGADLKGITEMRNQAVSLYHRMESCYVDTAIALIVNKNNEPLFSQNPLVKPDMEITANMNTSVQTSCDKYAHMETLKEMLKGIDGNIQNYNSTSSVTRSIIPLKV